jgi:A/G-specific adenine glycosylase
MTSNMTVKKNKNKCAKLDINVFRKKILGWYDKHQRTLPWRAPSKDNKRLKPNPYHVWLSEIMLQQTTVVTVGPYFEKFIKKWPTVHHLANAERDKVMHEWAGLGYYARARNLHKCAQVVSQELNGIFPQSQAELEKLPGIGAYTSAAIRAIAFNKPANVVDGNIERVMARLFAITEPMPSSKQKLKELAGNLSEGRDDRPGDYAQALMDLGATICTPKSPKCMLCPVIDLCMARAQGIEAELPQKLPKKIKPQKHAHVYWVKNNKNEVMFIRRAETEMLGGMLGLPTSDWFTTDKKIDPLKGAKDLKIQVKHSFTHFDLTLNIYEIKHKKGSFSPENNPIWVTSLKLEEMGLPTLFSKTVKLMK